MTNKSEFRDYSESPENEHVHQTYRLNHTNQTVDYVKDQLVKHCTKFDKAKISILDALNELDNLVDSSDPDLDLPQIVHAFQTAEGLRIKYPEPEQDWMCLVGLIHDLGKIIALPKYGNQPQWSTVGDTFPVGCRFSDKIVLSQYFENNPDFHNDKYNSKYGIYQKSCGLDNVMFSFGHDEYLYQVLKHNKCTIPEFGLKIIRYHSFYSWHKEKEYEYLMNEDDFKLRDACEEFSKSDLYTKDNNSVPNIETLIPFYENLIQKYFPNPIIEW